MRRMTLGGAAACLAASLCVAHASTAQEARGDKRECLEALEQGQSERDDGKYRAAREAFATCAREACPKLVAQMCTKWLREVDEDAPTVVLGAKNDRGDDLVDARVSFDAAPFASTLDGRPIGADAGEHTFRFERDGSLPVEKKLVLRAGEKARLVTVTLRSADAVAPSGIEAVATTQSDAYPPPTPSLFSARSVTTAATALGALAAAGTGALMVVKSSEAGDRAARQRAGRPSNACTDAPATQACESLSSDVSTQHGDMTAATWLFAGAGVLAVSSVLSWALWPRSHVSPQENTLRIEWSAGGLAVRVAGRFE